MLKQFFTPPVPGDAEQTRKARVLFWFLWGLIAVVTFTQSAYLLVLPQNSIRWLTVMLVVDTASLGLLGLNRRGQTRLASYLLLWLLFVVVIRLAWNGGGIHAYVIYQFPFVALIAGMLLSWRAGIITGLLCALCELGLVLAGNAGFLPASVVQHTTFGLWVCLIQTLALLLLLQYIAVENINHALKALREELARRQQTEESLRKSEEFRRRIFDSSRVPIVVMDHATFQFMDCNPAAVQIYRFSSRDEVLGKKPTDVSAPEQYDGTPSLEKARY